MKKHKNLWSAFWKKIRFKYRLSVLDETSLEEVFVVRTSSLSGLLIIGGFSVSLIILTSIIIIKTPIRNYLPGYMDAEIRNEMIMNTLRMDSLEANIHSKSFYIEHVNAILRGDTVLPKVPKPNTVNIDIDKMKKSERLDQFLQNYESEERYNLNVLASAKELPPNVIFFRPVKGFLIEKFNKEKERYGVDIATSPHESVLATQQGTVIFTGFDARDGYVIQIQHAEGFVSVYKHNALLLKKTGAVVQAGEAIAIANSEPSKNTCLHFELWGNMRPVDPEKYIVFETVGKNEQQE